MKSQARKAMAIIRPRICWHLFIACMLLSPNVFCSEGSDSDAAKAVLEKHCLTCHGASQMSGLDMRKRESLLKGGKRGPAIVPGKAADSLLYRSLSHQEELKMPPG